MVAPKGAVCNFNFTAVETVQRCLSATAQMLGLFRSSETRQQRILYVISLNSGPHVSRRVGGIGLLTFTEMYIPWRLQGFHKHFGSVDQVVSKSMASSHFTKYNHLSLKSFTIMKLNVTFSMG